MRYDDVSKAITAYNRAEKKRLKALADLRDLGVQDLPGDEPLPNPIYEKVTTEGEYLVHTFERRGADGQVPFDGVFRGATVGPASTQSTDFPIGAYSIGGGGGACTRAGAVGSNSGGGGVPPAPTIPEITDDDVDAAYEALRSFQEGVRGVDGRYPSMRKALVAARARWIERMGGAK